MKIVRFSKLTAKQKEALTTIIGLKNNIPTTYAQRRDSLDWNVMQSQDNQKLSKTEQLITICIQDSLEDLVTYFNQNSLELYCPIDKDTDAQLKKQLFEKKQENREQQRKKAALNGEFFNRRTRLF